MKKLFLIALLCTSCARLVPLKNQYDEQSRIAVISRPLQDVLDDFALLAVENSYPVESSDARSGLITVGPTKFPRHGGFESKSGRVPNPDAFIVAERYSDQYPDRTDKFTFTASWNLLIVPVDSRTTRIRIKLYDTKAFTSDYTLKGKSTGRFENWLIEQLSKK
ncbi:hypothetical protein DSL64_21490 [Dyadobacter luteus]|uniref:Uncharacterized protein n=1 Tax=Dyadobacter luteus TaxID=2259619 RepID=A0A3D8Y653_9BACT|nr:hypothetical protein [Dyadobacter luteus]REA58184.1 hypothetical protein DSL64_21490 [Dyadobacter luteus]